VVPQEIIQIVEVEAQPRLVLIPQQMDKVPQVETVNYVLSMESARFIQMFIGQVVEVEVHQLVITVLLERVAMVVEVVAMVVDKSLIHTV
jgi:hypothetical protein